MSTFQRFAVFIAVVLLVSNVVVVLLGQTGSMIFLNWIAIGILSLALTMVGSEIAADIHHARERRR